VVSNRRRPQRDEDLRLSIPTGPLYYDEVKHRLWTHSAIHLVDHKSKPKPHEIRGQGMELELHAEPAHPTGGQRPGRPERKPAREQVTGVKWIELKSAVAMRLFMDGKSGFLGGSGDQKEPPGKPHSTQPPQKSQVDITTPGKFRYDINKD